MLFNKRRAIILIAASVAVNVAVARSVKESVSLHYLGEEYVPILVQDTRKQVVVKRKLVTSQSISLPLLNAKGKKHKKFIVMVGERELELRLACKYKQLAKRIAADVFEIRYSESFVKKPPCFVADSVSAPKPRLDPA